LAYISGMFAITKIRTWRVAEGLAVVNTEM